ncbi:MAG: hypothetical protein A3I61_15075 [Acidobacteria bacterium RIFCSPLOWO2_02_FULL_68_18]|nr:MAG: hypothetical protein A3I61_15075 [Acidobacteria bacterium RIFCSPLOWO2_02_FULL_68_18]OFW50351.1 MAG: hypothetical protein A3G77_07750 [Acidobacteria bacterium RIFCSPLOWO2_12_FULL_68_19]
MCVQIAAWPLWRALRDVRGVGRPSPDYTHQGLSTAYAHNVIDHAEAYVDGEVHTNGMENFWSLLKRAIKGTYVSIRKALH